MIINICNLLSCCDKRPRHRVTLLSPFVTSTFRSCIVFLQKKHAKMAKVSCILTTAVQRVCARGCVFVVPLIRKSLTAPTPLCLLRLKVRCFLGVYPTSHYLLCIDCLSCEEQHDNTWNEVVPPYPLLIAFGERKPRKIWQCQVSHPQ